MKKTLLGLVLSTILFTTPVSAFFGSDSDKTKGSASVNNIAVIDMLKINKDAKVMISLNKQKDAALDKIQKEVAEKRKTFEGKEDELKTKQSVMDKEAFIKEIQSFQSEVLNYDKQTEQKVAGVEKAYIEALKTIQDDYLYRIVNKIGKEKGYSLVLNAQTAIVLDKNLDITTDVIEALNDEIKEIELKTK